MKKIERAAIATIFTRDRANAANTNAAAANSANNAIATVLVAIAELKSKSHPGSITAASATDAFYRSVGSVGSMSFSMSDGGHFSQGEAFFRAASHDANQPMQWGPLWPSTDQPDGLIQGWKALKQQWEEDEADWSFWIEWYESILSGIPLDWELTRRIALEVTEAEWDAGQSVVAERIREIQARFDVERFAKELAENAHLAQPGNRGIGDNNPPSLIDDDLANQPPETIIWVAANELREQAASETPEPSWVRKAISVLIGCLRSARLWTAKKIDKFVDAAAIEFGKSLGRFGGPAMVAYVTGIVEPLVELIKAALRWLPFLS